MSHETHEPFLKPEATSYEPAIPNIEARSEILQPLYDTLTRALGRRSLELGMELGSSGALGLLETLHNNTPSTRDGEYIENERLASISDQELFLKCARSAERVQKSVVEWYDFLTGSTDSTLELGNGEIGAEQLKSLTKQLGTTPYKLLKRFGYYYEHSVKDSGTSQPKIVEFAQTMLPYALFRLAYNLFPGAPGGTMTKADYFSQEMGESYTDFGDNNSPPNLRANVSFESPEKYKVFVATFKMLMGISNSMSALVAESLDRNIIANFSSLPAYDTFHNFAQQTFEAVYREFGMTSREEADEDIPMSNTYARQMALYAKETKRLGEKRFIAQLPVFLDRRLKAAQKEGLPYSVRFACWRQWDNLFEATADRTAIDSFDKFVALAQSRPLAHEAQRVEQLHELFRDFEIVDGDLLLDFEPAPPHVGLLGPRGSSGHPSETPAGHSMASEAVQSEPQTSEETAESERIARLRKLVAMWGSGAIARSKLPNLSNKRQYHIALLPEWLPNGELICHAVADNEEEGRHGAKISRGEYGLNEYGHVVRDWRQIFRLHKDEMKEYGVLHLNHSPRDKPDTLEDRIVEVLTRPVSKLPKANICGNTALQKTVTPPASKPI